jgi:transmembrane sensor
MKAPDRDNPAAHRRPSATEAAALAWIVRCDRGLTAGQAADLARWRAADPGHEKLFREFQGTWTLLSPSSGHAVSAPPTGNSRRRRHCWIGSGLAAAAAFTLAYLGWWRPAHYSAAPDTQVGELRSVHLPDGSQLTLNTNSALAVAFSPAERRIRLARGEAHFEVAGDRARPFVVEAGGVAVRAVGTAFTVQLRAAAVDVLVTEGTVAIARPRAASPAASVLVAAGHRTTVPVGALDPTRDAPASPPAVLPVAPDDVRRGLAWRERRLEFVSAPLAEIVAEFNRYNRHQLVITDPTLGAGRFGGAFRADDYAGLVRMLRENFEVEAEVGEQRTELRRQPAPAQTAK